MPFICLFLSLSVRLFVCFYVYFISSRKRGWGGREEERLGANAWHRPLYIFFHRFVLFDFALPLLLLCLIFIRFLLLFSFGVIFCLFVCCCCWGFFFCHFSRVYLHENVLKDSCQLKGSCLSDLCVVLSTKNDPALCREVHNEACTSRGPTSINL